MKKNVFEYQKNTVSYIKQKIRALNLTILLGIMVVLLIAFKFSYEFLNYIPEGSVMALLLILAVISGIIYALSNVATTRAIKAVESYSRKLNTLLSTSRDVHQIDYSDVLIENIIESAIGITNADGAILMKVNRSKIIIELTKGIVSKNYERSLIDQADGIAERVIRNGRMINIPDVNKTSIPLSVTDRKMLEGARSLLCMPISLNDKRIGALSLIKKEESFFTTEDEELLSYFAEQSTLAMKKNLLNEDLKNYEMHLTNILIESIERLTGQKGHLKRTVKYALLIGRGIKLPESELAILYRAAMLHDIGFLKMNIEEIASVEQYSAHVMHGFRILDQINFYGDISYAVLHHHERYDGKGYPGGLSGEAIPLIARIISIAEVFDVMINRGTHESKARNNRDNITRNKMEFKDAINELKRHAGTQFDPELVSVFINNINEDDVEVEQPHSGFIISHGNGKMPIAGSTSKGG